MEAFPFIPSRGVFQGNPSVLGIIFIFKAPGNPLIFLCPNQGRLKNATGCLVDSNDRAETLAQYYSEVQWAVRPTTLLDTTSPLGPPLPVNTGCVQDSEIIDAAGKLRRKKACGNDKIPPEFWKALCTKNSPAVKWATALCNKCWEEKKVPQAWHEALVTAI